MPIARAARGSARAPQRVPAELEDHRPERPARLPALGRCRRRRRRRRSATASAWASRTPAPPSTSGTGCRWSTTTTASVDAVVDALLNRSMTSVPAPEDRRGPRNSAPATRRAILDLILEDPDRVLEESFERWPSARGSSVPTIMRTCRDLGFAGLREFKLALAQELALGGSPLHRRVNIDDAADEVVAQDRAQRRGLGRRRAQPARHGGARRRRRPPSPRRRTSTCTAPAPPRGSWPTTCRRACSGSGLSANAWADYHLQQVAAARAAARAAW